VLIFYSNRVGCLGSVVISLIGSALILGGLWLAGLLPL